MKIKGNWSFLEIFVSGLTTLIFINYLVTGFSDVVINISNLLFYLQHNDLNQIINQLFR